ncbi:MAG: Asp-tRNA(Asn)/Glu-tRNA(Gln) amidotransferase subunit GatC [Bacteroidetes bacterium]|nr:Asp-tRNA(Asn)/Glu-tRNA(Gln) amidotransferase subunit GatC [Bacteroidota bacterium]
MEITEEKLDKLSKIAKIDIANNKKEIKKDLESISSWVKKINQFDTDKVEPLLNMSKETNNMREDDKIFEVLKHSEVLKNAPEHDSNYFRIFSYIEKENS